MAYPSIEELRLRLEAHVRGDEEILALGRTEWLRSPDHLGSSTHDFVGVTGGRLLWTGWSGPVHELPFELVRSAADGTRLHHYALLLRHEMLMRSEWVPKHRFLRFRWGNATAMVARTATAFGFSRRDTDAAQEIRKQLAHRKIPMGRLVLPDAAPRSSRIAGSRRRLTSSG